MRGWRGVGGVCGGREGLEGMWEGVGGLRYALGWSQRSARGNREGWARRRYGEGQGAPGELLGTPGLCSPPPMVLCPLTCGRVPTRGGVPRWGVVSVFPSGRVFHASPPTPSLSWGGLWCPHGAGAAPLCVLGIFVWFWGVSMLGSSHKPVGLWLGGTTRIIRSQPH